MTKPAPKGGAMRLAPDVWDVLALACDRKGMTSSDRRVAAEAILRSFALVWAGDSPVPQSQPAIASPAIPSEPFDAAKALDSLIDSI